MSTSNLQREVGEKLRIAFGHMRLYENTKPRWLTMPDGTRLELDFYFPKIKVAVEVQGEQHYGYVPFFHGTYENFERRQERDGFKREHCRLNGVSLYEVSAAADIPRLVTKVKGHTYPKTLFKKKHMLNLYEKIRQYYYNVENRPNRVEKSFSQIIRYAQKINMPAARLEKIMLRMSSPEYRITKKGSGLYIASSLEVDVECQCCGGLIDKERYLSAPDVKYCSKRCYKKAKRGRNLAQD